MPDPARFQNRWRITGTLTTASPLHIGDGFSEERRLGTHIKSETQSIMRAARNGQALYGRPFIPASSLKGILRARLERAFGKAEIGPLLGTAQPDAPDACGGKAGFHDAHAPSGFQIPAAWKSLPFWDESRWTAIETSVAIDRRSRSASEHKLMHTEYVPARATFQVSITGQDFSLREVALLVWVLRQLNDPHDPIALGSDTGNDWGRAAWSSEKVECFTAQDLPAWLALPCPPVAFDAVRPLTVDEQRGLDEEIQKLAVRTDQASGRIVVHLRLEFDGPFAVRRTAPKLSGLFQKAKGNHPSDTKPRLTSDGRALLPARSFRGVIRSRAERILRSLAGDAAAPDPTERVETGAFADLSLAGQMFGAANWRSPIECSDFISNDKAIVLQQDFVAIDRFTGSVSGSKKFDMEYTWRPILTGTLALRFPRWKRVEHWSTGLLALVLRDLIEGDLTFGLGASKGLGTCSARIDKVVLSDGTTVAGDALTSAHRSALEKHVDTFRASLRSPSPAPRTQTHV